MLGFWLKSYWRSWEKSFSTLLLWKVIRGTATDGGFFLLGHTGGYWRSDKLSFINAVEPRGFKIVGEIQNLCLIFEIVLFEKRKELNGVISEIWWYILLAFFTHRTFWDLWNVYIWSYFSLCLVTKCYCHTCQVLKI